jgi:hypothetical protein
LAGDERKEVSVFLGVGFGTDSNPGRETAGNVESSALLAEILGLALKRGNNTSAYDFRVQARLTQYLELGEYDHTEAVASFRMARGTEGFRLKFYAEYGMLADPVIDASVSVLERDRFTAVPDFDLAFGVVELGLGGSATTRPGRRTTTSPRARASARPVSTTAYAPKTPGSPASRSHTATRPSRTSRTRPA